MAFNKKDIAEQLKMMERQLEMQSKLNDSALEYAKHMKVIAEQQRNINHINEQINAEKKKEKDLTDQLSKSLKNVNDLDEVGLRLLIAKRNAIKEELIATKNNTKSLEVQVGVLQDINDEHVEAAQNVSKINIGLKEGLKFLEKTPGLIRKGYGRLKGYGVFDMDKSIRMAGVEMGKMANIGTAFGKDIIKASTETQSMGMHVKDLAKMQSSYSSELGRSVMLSEEGFDAMSQMASGTILGAEGAASLAAEMDSFNISAIGTKDIIEGVTETSEKMGLNAGKVIKTLQNNLKMANKYHFKGGVKGMVKMAAQATKFKMSMETTAQFADKLFNIEGAGEMAASLNTMGGEWAKLGDPMKLMHMARNDMEGLQTSVIDATAGMADFNRETGVFSFSGLELHRMKELEKITGISAEQMAEMAKSKAKFAKISGQMGIDVAGDEDMKAFIENGATFNDKTKQFELKLSGYDDAIPVKELTASHKTMMEADAANLKERAENSQSFDEQLTNMVKNAKSLLLPLLEGMNKALPDMIEGFKEFMGDTESIAATVKSIAETAGNIIGGAIKIFTKLPTALKIGIGLLMGPGKWILNGLSLAKGFMMGTKGMGGAGGGSLGSGGNGFGRSITKGARKIGGRRGGAAALGAGKMLRGAGSLASLGGGLVGGYLGDMGSEAMGNEDTITGDISSMLGGLIGGALGTLVAPGIGTAAGAALGAAGGKMIGDYFASDGGGVKTIPIADKVDDAILADGKVTPIDTKDQVFQVSKPGGAFDKTGTPSPGTSGGSTHQISITFSDILVKSEGDSAKIDLGSDSAFMRELATKIKQSLSETAGGGVLNPNPS